MFKVEPESLDSTSPLYSPIDEPLIDVKQEKYDVTVMENVTKVSYICVSACCYQVNCHSGNAYGSNFGGTQFRL
jgi:hypothetical protein